MELLQRVERAFNVSLPEQTFFTAETPRDLLHDVLRATELTKPFVARDEVRPPVLEKTKDAPHSARTLLEVLAWHVDRHPQRPHIYLYSEGDEPEEITYAALLEGAQAIAAGLRQHDLQPGQTVAIMLPTSRDYLFSFYGVLLAGGVPVPIYPPARLSQLEDHLRRHAGILNNALASLLITVPEAQLVARLLRAQVPQLRRVVTPQQLSEEGEQVEPFQFAPQGEDVAMLQYTSGSTGSPKGVVLTHAELLANIRAMGDVTRADSSDVFVSWLPMYHDMGLIGAWLGSLYYACPLVLMSPLAFLARPSRWLWVIHKHRATLSAAPNFAYELCLSKVEDSDIKGLDLSSWRAAYNGAEPVSPQTVRRFSERFASYGFKQTTMTPVYGLAECAVGLAFPPPGRAPLIDRIQRDSFEASGKAVPVEKTDAEVLEFVACGQPLPGYQIRIVDPAGRELPEREEGRLQFRGPSVTQGYFRNPEKTRDLFDGEWLDSGDLAYLAGGDVYLTSRVKDIIIRAGRNIYPYEVEEAVGDIAGIRKGCVAIFGCKEDVSGTERVVVLAETHETAEPVLERLRGQVTDVATDLLGTPPDDVVIAPPHTVLKTSSGKIRRAASREQYEQGRIGAPQRAVWRQFLRLSLAGLLPQWRRVQRRLSDTLYAAYAWSLFWILAPLVWLTVVCAPVSAWRWVIMRGAARLLARLTRTTLHVEGLEHLPAGQPCVIVCNHSSYLDGMLLVATLPMPFSFVAKQEFTGRLRNRLFLQRIDAVFVERFDTRRGVADVEQLVKAARAGRSLSFFPEGTFTRMPGLLPFRMGAFVTAVEAGLPVLPVVIRGTRSMLRGSSSFPRRGSLNVTVCPPIRPQGSDWEAAIHLRDAARGEIQRYCGEPDLDHEIPLVKKDE
jgi:1-acyl-sn-glycerol-3-phosphate acyltransferase